MPNTEPMLLNNRLPYFLFLFAFLFSCKSPQQERQPRKNQVRNVILLIGDGMGLSQVSSSFYFGATEEPNFVRFPVVGLINTSSAVQKVTDSAAGATAFGSGVKTYNGAIGVDVNGKSVQTMCERLEPQGISTGLIATSSITHATPACFYAHASKRKFQDSIAAQLPESGVDFFAGGGLKFFENRPDNLRLVQELENSGYVMDTSGLLPKAELDPAKQYGYLLAPKGLPSKLEGRDDFLIDATQLALNHLSKQKGGFFLMVEGSQIDWESHGTSVEGVVQEVKDFDKAIGAALDFAEQDGHTLVVVTADHETGGFALSPPLVEREITPDSSVQYWNYKTVGGSFYNNSTVLGSSAHTASLIPVFAYGPGAEAFGGIYQNNEIFHKIVQMARW